MPDFKNDAFKGVIGVAQVDMTPPADIFARSWGAARHDRAEGIHMPLLLTCVTLRASREDRPFVLLSADLGVWRDAAVGEKIREAILREFSVPLSQLMFCLTHTHAGPVLSPDDAEKPGGDLIEPYIAALTGKVLEAVRAAMDTAVPAVLTWNYGTCRLAEDRDFEDKKGGGVVTGFNPSKSADDTLLVGRITDLANNITGVLVNYACHPTTLAWENRLISPDYVGAMREVIRRHTDAPCLFLQGASGELAPRRQYVADTKIADSNGRTLGHAVLAALEDMLPAGIKLSFDKVVRSGADLGVWRAEPYEVSGTLEAAVTEVTYQLKPMPSLKEIEQQYRATEDRVARERLWRQRSLRINLGDGDSAKVGLWAWRVGDALLIGQPNEAYSEFQIKIRSEIPGAIAVINLANGSAGYLAPRALYDKPIYQVWQSPFMAGSLERLYEATLQMIKGISL